MAKRVVWKEGDVVSLKLREGLFTVGQMCRSPYMAFFNVKSADGQFGELDLNQVSFFCVIPVARDFLQRRVEGKLKQVVAKSDVSIPLLWLSPQRAYAQKFIWRGADLVKIDPQTGDLGMRNPIVKRNFQPRDDEELNKYEVTNVRTDGGLVARLIVSLERGANLDPFRAKVLLGKDPYGVYD
jgi:hypothetical protein